LKYGDPEVSGPNHNYRDLKECTVPLCGSDHKAMGLCERHYARRASLWHKYSLRWSDYMALGERCNWSCGGCGLTKLPHEDYSLHVDHNYETRTVRGLLCGSCNRGMGLLRDSPEVLRKLADYIEAYDG
jgi:hypothetical protein